MHFSRRQFGVATASAPFIAGAAVAPAQADGHAAIAGAALYDASLGNYTITALLDGVVPLQRGFFFGVEDAVVDKVLAEAGQSGDALPAPINAFLLTSGERNILIDAGMGALDRFGDGFGRIEAGLAVRGLSAADIDTIVLTHLHPDHIGGLLQNGAPVFTKAEVIVAEAEATFWSDAAMMAAASEDAQGLFQLAQTTLIAYGDQVTQVASDAEIAPGVSLTLSPGHTPGHSVLRIDGGERQLMMVADTIHNADLHTALPEIGFGFDVDTAMAAQSRLRLFDMLSSDQMLIAGSHLHFPGFGRIVRAGDAFRFVPATWT